MACAYTPSRGVISVRGNWPLTPTMDVVVPYARTMVDLLRYSTWWSPMTPTSVATCAPAALVPIPRPRRCARRRWTWRRCRRPQGQTLRRAAHVHQCRRRSRHFAKARYRGPTGQRIHTRASVIALWQQARRPWKRPRASGGRRFPAGVQLKGTAPAHPRCTTAASSARNSCTTSCGSCRAGASMISCAPMATQAQPPGGCRWASDFPARPGHPAQPRRRPCSRHGRIRQHGQAWPENLGQIETLPDGLRGLERTRKLDLEDWMDAQGLDAVLFPTVADVGPAMPTSTRYRRTSPGATAYGWPMATWRSATLAYRP